MDANQTTHVLNIFAQYSHCFTLEELSNFADSDSDNEILRHALLTDSRFMQLEDGGSDEKHSIPKTSLFQWFCQLSLKLAQAKQTRLSKHQVAMLMSSLRIDGRWDTPPMEAVQFGSHFGFIGPAWTSNKYVFPLAHILSFAQDPTKVTSIVMENFTAEEKAYLAFEQPLQELIQEGFSKLTTRQRYVIQAREGILTGRRMTLQQIGDRLAITRERARQIEAKFWDKFRQRPRGRSLAWLFSTALIYDLISKQGSLIVPQNSPEAFLLSFLAKCTDVPQAEFPHSKMLILGASPKDVMLPKSTGSVHEDIDRDSIATRLESEGRLCLINSDLKILAESIAQFRRKRLTKEQKAYLTLRAIGRPAHYSEVTEVYNSLFPNELPTEHNLHAVLSREKHGVVWIGIKGTFALKEWGYEHPTITLFDAVTEIVEEKYKETAQPVPFVVIVAEMGKRRQVVNPSSLVIATQCNRNLRRVGKDSFVPKEPSEEIQEEISAEELDKILREFEKEGDKGAIEQQLPSTLGNEPPPPQFRHALLSLKQKLTSLRS
ncbi:RNA polymerase sigma factor RpoD [subsurface metagenome]